MKGDGNAKEKDGGRVKETNWRDVAVVLDEI